MEVKRSLPLALAVVAVALPAYPASAKPATSDKKTFTTKGSSVKDTRGATGHGAGRKVR